MAARRLPVATEGGPYGTTLTLCEPVNRDPSAVRTALEQLIDRIDLGFVHAPKKDRVYAEFARGKIDLHLTTFVGSTNY